MKRICSTLLLLASAWPLELKAAEPKPACETTVGPWEITGSGWPGRFIGAEAGSKYLFVFFRTSESRKSTAPSSDAEKAEAYSTAAGGAWEYTCEGSRMKLHPLFSLNPADVGKEYLADFEVQGDTMRWWFLGADGKRGEMDTARRTK